MSTQIVNLAKFQADSADMLASIKRKSSSLSEEEARALLTMVYWQSAKELAQQVAALESENEALKLAVQANELLLEDRIPRKKDDAIRDIVNQLTDTAKRYSLTHQLRERIAAIIVPLLKGEK